MRGGDSGREVCLCLTIQVRCQGGLANSTGTSKDAWVSPGRPLPAHQPGHGDERQEAFISRRSRQFDSEGRQLELHRSRAPQTAGRPARCGRRCRPRRIRPLCAVIGMPHATRPGLRRNECLSRSRHLASRRASNPDAVAHDKFGRPARFRPELAHGPWPTLWRRPTCPSAAPACAGVRPTAPASTGLPHRP